jgi:hypothetical protein
MPIAGFVRFSLAALAAACVALALFRCRLARRIHNALVEVFFAG